MASFPQNQIERLAKRLLAGEVVFFIGAGFSLDSEGNTANALIARLLARFDSLVQVLTSSSVMEVRQRAEALRQALQDTFRLSSSPAGSGAIFSDERVKSLAREYYHFNDWICTAFADLLQAMEKIKPVDREPMSLAVSRIENGILAGTGRQGIDPINFATLSDISDVKKRGKALFLETMGFASLRVMAGEPLISCFDQALASYGDRLRARHQVLAWLAREGLSSILVTTNYDLLLEGAYRAAGLSPRRFNPGPGGSPSEQDRLPAAKFRFFSRIADAVDFFGHGEDHETALIVKIHGCAGEYRRLRGTVPELERYLPSIVFTFREVQNWREDSWSRDLLRTLLRTRTMVFCGYSGADPVIHDTFRSVYEEMGTRRQRRSPSPSVQPEDAPAFFMGIAESREFHGLEILRAASQSIGASNLDLTDHPNYLRFYREDDKRKRFPRLDETMRWLFHIVVRSRQAQLLESDLRRVATVMLGHPPPEADLAAIRRHFESLLACEAKSAAGWKNRGSSRPRFERVIGWTESFHLGLMREFALADVLLRDQRPGADLRVVARWPWYKPMTDHPDRVAWSVVVELALRRLIAHLRRARRHWAEDTPAVEVVNSSPPSVGFSTKRRTPVCLTLSLSYPDRLRIGTPPPRGFFSRHVVWGLRPESIPWSREALGTPGAPDTPSAADLWQLASQPHKPSLIRQLRAQLEPLE